MKNFVFVLTVLLTLSVNTFAASNASNASAGASALGSSTVVEGSVQIFAAGVEFSVTAVEVVGELAYLTLAASEAAAVESATIVLTVATNLIETTADVASNVARTSTTVSKAASIAVGDIVTSAAVGSGYMLIASGYVIAYIPTEIGTSLILHERH